MVTKPNPHQVIEQMGGAQEVHVGLREFSNRVREFDAKRVQLTEKYPNKWIAMHSGEIRTIADSIEDLLKEMDCLGIPRKGAVIEFMDTERRTMIL
jgi:benzoyl-CoA reductase/2-hydroxyglutaryl-CoA dehydratase subunit BcrC/BadD/HgdB